VELQPQLNKLRICAKEMEIPVFFYHGILWRVMFRNGATGTVNQDMKGIYGTGI
jgi:hypothetical protein